MQIFLKIQEEMLRRDPEGTLHDEREDIAMQEAFKVVVNTIIDMCAEAATTSLQEQENETLFTEQAILAIKNEINYSIPEE